jgi:UDPglucose 6-dehydrogenase
MREAPSITIIKALHKAGARLTGYDPAAMDKAKLYLKDVLEYAQNQYDLLENADALLILTEWNEFRNPDFDIIKSLMTLPLIFDGRNIYDPEKMRKLGFSYYSIGRKSVRID